VGCAHVYVLYFEKSALLSYPTLTFWAKTVSKGSASSSQQIQVFRWFSFMRSPNMSNLEWDINKQKGASKEHYSGTWPNKNCHLLQLRYIRGL